MHKNQNNKEKYISLRELGAEGPYAYVYLAKLAKQGLLRAKLVDGDYYTRRRHYVDYLETFIKEKNGKVKKGIKEYVFKYWKEQVRLKEVLDEYLPENVSEFLQQNEDKGISDFDIEDVLIEDWLKHTAYVKEAVENTEILKATDTSNQKLKAKAEVLNKKREKTAKKEKGLLERIIIPKVSLEPKGYIGSQFIPWNWKTSLASVSVLALFISAIITFTLPSISKEITDSVAKRFSPPVERFRDFAVEYGYIDEDKALDTEEEPLWQNKNYRVPTKEEFSQFIRDYNWHYNSKGYTVNEYQIPEEQMFGQVAGVEEEQ